jgi:hypothetical protein
MAIMEISFFKRRLQIADKFASVLQCNISLFASITTGENA